MFSLRSCFTILAAAFLFTAATPARAQSDIADIEPAKRKEINRLLELTGMNKLMGQMMDQMFTQMRANGGSELTDDFLNRFRKSVDVDELVNLLIPIYDRNFTLEDLQAINAFYATESGKRMLAAMPQVMSESMQAGQQWGQKIGQKVMAELEKERAAKKK